MRQSRPSSDPENQRLDDCTVVALFTQVQSMRLDVVLRQVYPVGEKAFVVSVGPTVEVNRCRGLATAEPPDSTAVIMATEYHDHKPLDRVNIMRSDII